ncbi:MAG: F0F1 ATP synthase subunit B [Erysipelotrichaceae bacterium]|nr:F0F1 ATP synthase subunit B [Erysipelotrichaceae bacterium]
MKSFLMLNLFLTDGDAFSSLKEIAEKIIPDDPWAFVVQLFATFVLVLILAKFLVKPARKFIAARKEYIQTNLDEAAIKNQEATTLLENANNQIKDAKQTSKEIIENAKVSALNEKDRILNEAQDEVIEMKDKARKDLENERKQMQEQLSSEVIDVALLAASKVVERNVTSDDNRKIISSFIEDDK